MTDDRMSNNSGPERCATCQGDGWTLESDHAPECWGNCGEESETCPVQVQAECRACGGSGRLG